MIESINSPYIHAATSDNFKSLVLENSKVGPVLVNFWSRKAGPCLRQYPILDKLIHDFAGRLLLVNVDIEKEFVFTKEYGVASVPTLKLFRGGQVIETLHGYQSEKDLKKLLDVHVVRDSDQTLAAAIKSYAEGKHADAYEMIVDAIVTDPINPRLPLAMCKLLIHEGRYEEALNVIDTLPDDVRENNDVVKQHAILGFHVEAQAIIDVDALASHIESHPDDAEAKQQLIAYLVIDQQYEQALRKLVAIMDIDKDYNYNYPQKAMLRMFDILGTEHPLVSKFRPFLRRYSH